MNKSSSNNDDDKKIQRVLRKLYTQKNQIIKIKNLENIYMIYNN